MGWGENVAVSVGTKPELSRGWTGSLPGARLGQVAPSRRCCRQGWEKAGSSEGAPGTT